MKKIKALLLTLGFALAMLVGTAPAHATVYGSPMVKDAPGGTWGKTCRYNEQKNWNGSTTYREVRERNYWWGKTCKETGYAPTSWAKNVYLVWYY